MRCARIVAATGLALTLVFASAQSSLADPPRAGGPRGPRDGAGGPRGPGDAGPRGPGMLRDGQRGPGMMRDGQRGPGMMRDGMMNGQGKRFDVTYTFEANGQPITATTPVLAMSVEQANMIATRELMRKVRRFQITDIREGNGLLQGPAEGNGAAAGNGEKGIGPKRGIKPGAKPEAK